MNENKTLDNLMEAFAGEAQANSKYLAYAKKAEKEGSLTLRNCSEPLLTLRQYTP